MKTKLLLVLVILIHAVVHAQEIPKIFPASPEAASLAKFINYPVSYNTGIPDINIPLLEVKSGEITLPITLNYHAGGIKVNERATWVGLGWSLNAEPEITRAVNGVDDFSNAGYLNSDVGNTSLTRNLTYLKNMVNNQIDENPDEFYFKLLNKSGKFYFHKFANGTHKAFTIPYKQLKIDYSAAVPITITDDDGTFYRFGKNLANQNALEAMDMGDRYATTSWKCTEIISSNKKDTVSFTYSGIRDKITYNFTEKYEIHDNERIANTNYEFLGYNNVQFRGGIYNSVAGINGGAYVVDKILDENNDSTVVWTPQSNTVEIDPGIVLQVSKSIKVNEIKFRTGKVQFFLRSNLNMLDSIKVYDFHNSVIKTIVFHYGNFGGTAYVGTVDDRTRLDSVEIRGNNLAKVETYSFEYNSGYGIPFGSKRADLMGYHGPNISFQPYFYDYDSAVPEQTVNIIRPRATPGANVTNISITIGSTLNPGTPAPDYMQAFILKKIKLPTGGHTEFNYETNKYYDQLHADTVKTSGLRVKSIVSYRNSTDEYPLVKNYVYGEGECGFGLTTGFEALNTHNFEQTIYFTAKDYVSSGNAAIAQRRRTYSANSYASNAFSDGSPVVYSEVAEYNTDMGNWTGKTVYKYDYPINFFLIDINWTPMSFKKTDWNVGTLTSQVDYTYSYADLEYKWLRKKEYTYYRYDRPEKIYVGKVFQHHIVVYDPDYPFMISMFGEQYEDIIYGAVPMDVGIMLPAVTTTSTRTVDDLSNILTQSITYHYDNPEHIMATRIDQVNSKGDKQTTYTTFPQDHLSSQTNIAALLTANKIASAIESVVTLTRPTETEQIIGGTVNTYDTNGIKDATYSLETLNPIPLTNFKFSNVASGQLPFGNTILSFNKDSHYQPKINFDSYDDRGNIQQFTVDFISTQSYKWGYRKSYPIAECKGAAFDEFFIEDFEGNGALTSNTSSSHTGNGGYSGTINLSTYFSSTYHSKSYVVSYFKLNGSNWEYIIQNYTGQTISGVVDDIRIYPKDASITSSTYIPLVGMQSQIDNKGVTVFYEYDFANRLKNIKNQKGDIVKSIDYNYIH